VSGAASAPPTTGGALPRYVDAEHQARHEAHLRTEARVAEMRALPPGGRAALYDRLREEYRALRGVTWEVCARRSRIRGDLTLLEMLGREARDAATRPASRQGALFE
jgi:hypothetical protein